MFTQHAPRPLAAGAGLAPAAGPPRLSLYTQPPDGEASVDELEAFALDRLQVLRAVEDAHLRGRGDDDVRRRIDAALARHLPTQGARGSGAARLAAAERRKDAVSHFVLRLAFSRSDDLRTWFVRQEAALLRHRSRAADAAERRDARLGPAAAAFYGAGEAVYAVAFERVPALVARAQAVVRAGVAYVAAGDVAALVEAAFRDALTAALALCARALPQLGEDERLLPVLQSLGRQSARAEYQPTGAAGALTAEAVAPLAAAFPPCMRHLHAQLERDRHLRHAGRLQLGLFLKAAGLPLADALV
ncbi:DNA primase subunit pri2, partial [Coemansia sp. RSA 2603]